MTPAAEVLIRAARGVRKAWAQGYLTTMDGAQCALGWLQSGRKACNADIDVLIAAQEALHAAIPPTFARQGTVGTIIDWNDEAGQTAEAVASTMERAAAVLS